MCILAIKELSDAISPVTSPAVRAPHRKVLIAAVLAVVEIVVVLLLLGASTSTSVCM